MKVRICVLSIIIIGMIIISSSSLLNNEITAIRTELDVLIDPSGEICSNIDLCDNNLSDFLEEIRVKQVLEKNSTYPKVQCSLLDLISHAELDTNHNISSLFDIEFVDDLIRLEISLDSEESLDFLKDFSDKIIFENHYRKLAQILIPPNLIMSLSEEEYVQYIRNPVKPHLLDVTSEGVSIIGADMIHNLGINGEGVKVAVIDAGFKDYTTNPELPPDRIIEAISFRADNDIEAGTSHGSACAEIILDVAPQADLYLYNFETISELNDAVLHCISVGIDIISFSLGYIGINHYDGIGYDEWGNVISIVENARTNGILFIVASGNQADSHYQGIYNDFDDFHNFGGGNVFLPLGYYPAGYPYDITLSWDDWPYSNQDYDLYLYAGNAGEIVDSSEFWQTGSQPPLEFMIDYTPYNDYYYIFIIRYDATIDVHLELYGANYNPFLQFNHPGSSLTCPADAFGAMTVGATYWQNDNLESYSSRGPTNDGRTKPDVTAPTGVSTHAYGAGEFYGTSASAPHVAGAAALLLENGPLCTADDLQNILESTAVDLGTSGKNNLYGSGRIDVWDAYLSMTPTADFTYSPINPSKQSVIEFTDISTDPDGDIVSWYWDFGDGDSSTDQHPTHQYTTYGTYTVSLEVTDNHGVTNTTTQQIQVLSLPPVFNNPDPSNESTEQELSFTWSITIEDPEGDTFNWNIECSNGQSNSANDDINGTKSLSISGLSFNTQYMIWVNATDGFDWTREWFLFTTREQTIAGNPIDFTATADGRFIIDLSWIKGSNADRTYIEYHSEDEPIWNPGDQTFLYNDTGTSTSLSDLLPGQTVYFKAWSWNSTDNAYSTGVTEDGATDDNNPPEFTQENPANNSDEQELSFIWSLTIQDLDGDNFDWSIECSNGQSDSGIGSSDGIKSLSLSGLDYGMKYTVWVNASDDWDTTNEWFSFTSRNLFIPNPPTGFTAETYNRTAINLTWTKGLHADYTNITYTTEDYPVDINSGIPLYNGTGTSLNISGLEFNTTYYFRAWSYNVTDNCFSLDNSSVTNTTDSNTPPLLSNPEPSNQSTNQLFNPTLFITVNDFDSDLMNVTFRTNSSGIWEDIGYNASSEDGTYSQATSSMNDYHTTYWWSVNATDGFDWTNETFYFTTTNTVYVNKNYYSGTSGWETTSFSNLTKAISTVSDNVTIRVDPGIYRENLTIDKPLTITANSSLKPVLDGIGLTGMNITSNFTAIQNLEITNCSRGIELYGLSLHNISIERNDFYNCSAALFSHASFDNSSMIIRYNKFLGDNITMGMNFSNEFYEINATLNYWGSITGPFNAIKNPDGRGINISGNVVFNPWIGINGGIIYADQINTTRTKDGPNEFNASTDIGVVKINISTTGVTNITVAGYSTNPEGISGTISTVGGIIDLEVEDETKVVWPINLTMYYKAQDLLDADILEEYLEGILRWNNTAEKWELYNDTGVNTTIVSINGMLYKGFCWANIYEGQLSPKAMGTTKVIPFAPTDFSATKDGTSRIVLSWTKNSSADTTYIEYRTSSGSWQRDTESSVYNGTDESKIHSNLSKGTTYYYQAWSYNSTDNIYSMTPASASATTDSASSPPPGGDPPPGGIPPSMTPSILITDISHFPEIVTFEDTVEITATIPVTNGIHSVILYYKVNDEQQSTVMSISNNNTYIAMIGPFLPGLTVSYYISVVDDSNETISSSTNSFNVIDISGPNVTLLSPIAGSTISDTRPLIIISYSDPSGIDVDSIQFFFNSIDMTSNATVSTSQLTYMPSTPVSYGQHTILFSIADTIGNVEDKNWTFIIEFNENVVIATIDAIEKNETVEIALEDHDSIVQNIVLTSSTNLTNVKIICTLLDSDPWGVSNHEYLVYRYLNFESNVDDSDIEGLLVTFRVSKEWFVTENIDMETILALWFYSDELHEMPTIFIDEDDSFRYYQLNFATF